MGIQNDKIFQLVNAIGNLEEKMVYESVIDFRSQGMSPSEIQKCVNIGMKLVDGYYQSGEYFLADLIYAGHIYNKVLQMKQMQAEDPVYNPIGKVVIGTLNGDIHDIGKNIVANTLRSNAFEVINLGVDLSSDDFISAVAEHQPDIAAISCILSTSINELEKLIHKLKDKKGLSPYPKILIGGNNTLAQNYREIGADAYGKDEIDSLDLCKSFIQGKNK